MKYLDQLNKNLFLWINQDAGYHYAWLDSIMVFLSDATNGAIGLVLVTFFAFWHSGKSAWRIIALLGVLLALSDWSGAQFKYWFAIERPCHTLEGVRLLEPCVHYSFPSNHAINMAAAATYIGWHYRALIPPMAVLAMLVGISRVYVGMHYPGDVLFGWIWGAMLAAFYCWFAVRFIPCIRYKKRKASNLPGFTNGKDLEK